MNNILHMKRPRSRGHVTCDMCGTHVECDECANLCMSDCDMWDDGVTADDIQEWARQSSHPVAARYLDRCKRTERLGAAS